LTQSFESRRKAIIAKLSEIGDLTPQFLLDLLARAGFTVEIQEFLAKQNHCGSALCGTALCGIFTHAYWFRINSDTVTRSLALCGTAVCGDRISTFSGWRYQTAECGTAVCGQVIRNYQALIQKSAKCGVAVCGDKIAEYTGIPIRCLVERHKPAYTKVLYGITVI